MKKTAQDALFRALPSIPKKVIRRVVSALFVVMRDRLLDEGSFRLDHVGLLHLRRWHARRGQDFNGNVYQLASRLVLAIRSTKSMRLAISERKDDDE